MGNLIKDMVDKGVIHHNEVPSWLPNNVMNIIIMGSAAYGVSIPDSDLDLYGFVIPPKDYIFPHLRGDIPGFGTPGPSFNQWQKHHVLVPAGVSIATTNLSISLPLVETQISYMLTCKQR